MWLYNNGILTIVGYLMPYPLYTYIKYIVGFHDISTLVGYLKTNPIFTYILNVYDLQTHFVDTFLNKPELILLYTVKWFQVFLSNTNISIYY